MWKEVRIPNLITQTLKLKDSWRDLHDIFLSLEDHYLLFKHGLKLISEYGPIQFEVTWDINLVFTKNNIKDILDNYLITYKNLITDFWIEWK